MIPFEYWRTSEQNQEYWTDLFNSTKYPVLFNGDTLIAVGITQSFYYAPGDMILSMTQLIEFDMSGVIKGSVKVQPISLYEN